jgi:hypothetical protein
MRLASAFGSDLILAAEAEGIVGFGFVAGV